MVIVQSAPRSRSSAQNYVHHTALQAYDAGVSIIPIRNDGTKQPLLRWQPYQHRQATVLELEHWFRLPGPGIAFVTGMVSGGLEALDFDCIEVYTAWLRSVERDARLQALYERISRGYEEATPAGGRHLLYRCDVVAGNRKLARRPVPEPQQFKSLIETRGEGGFLIVAPSRGGVHPSGKAYILRRGSIATIQKITPKEREALLESAQAFDEIPRREQPCIPQTPRRSSTPIWDDGQRPGDLFNRLASWEEVLIPHGWQLVREISGEGYWRRPGKIGPGISATTNYSGSDLLYVFSTSTIFEPERGYTRFSAYAILNHNGDFSAAARALIEQGYVAREATA